MQTNGLKLPGKAEGETSQLVWTGHGILVGDPLG